jgi:hypothetical protein
VVLRRIPRRQVITPPTLIATQQDSLPLISISRPLQWGITEQIEGRYRITRPAHIKYGLRIFDEERTDRSRWGPIDGINDEEEEPLANAFRFGSEGGDTPDPDTVIPTSEIEQHAIAALAQLIPTHITRPSIPSISGLPSLASRMSQIASTTTITPTSVLARTLGAGIPTGGTQSANTIRNTLGGGGRLGGRPPGGTGPPLGPPSGGPNEDPDETLEEGEILETLEEGEIPDNPLITQKIDSPIN